MHISINYCLNQKMSAGIANVLSILIEIRDFETFALCSCVIDTSSSDMKEGIGIEQYSIWATQAHTLCPLARALMQEDWSQTKISKFVTAGDQCGMERLSVSSQWFFIRDIRCNGYQ